MRIVTERSYQCFMRGAVSRLPAAILVRSAAELDRLHGKVKEKAPADFHPQGLGTRGAEREN